MLGAPADLRSLSVVERIRANGEAPIIVVTHSASYTMWAWDWRTSGPGTAVRTIMFRGGAFATRGAAGWTLHRRGEYPTRAEIVL